MFPGQGLPRFWLFSAISLLGYLIFFRLFPLIPAYNQVPLSDVRTFTPSLVSGLGYGVLLVAIYGVYGLTYRGLKRGLFAITLSQILVTTAVFTLPLLFTYPINANDLYRYYIRGRIRSVQGESPFTQPPNAFPDDPYLPLAGEWADATSPYGPFWELAAAGITSLAPDNLLLGMVLFKLLGAVAHGATAVLIWQLLVHRETAVRAAVTLLWAWNPALLLFFVTDAHNDVLMIFWLVLGYWVIQSKKRPLLGFLILVLGVLTKPIGLLVLPFFFLAEARQLKTSQERRSFLAKTAVGSLLLTALAFLPFGSPLDLATRLLSEASAGGGFSPIVFLILLVRGLGGSVSLSLLSQIALGLFGLTALWLMWGGLAKRPFAPIRQRRHFYCLCPTSPQLSHLVCHLALRLAHPRRRSQP
ncbi:MAG: polyprenol phosphomannose-dependent alpha 1,6 mannosyltransferase MptB [Chloroflexota bacterium]